MQQNYVPPQFKKDAFNCPMCNAYSSFRWVQFIDFAGNNDNTGFHGAKCCRCNNWTMWRRTGESYGPEGEIGRLVAEEGELVFPKSSPTPPPSEDFPSDCIDDYNQAREVFTCSPTAAAALLRLCIQKICKHLGEPGNNINTDIGNLVNKGLDQRVQKALDIVRISGNNAVHPGEMDLSDRPDIAYKLFEFTNLIVTEMITKPKELERLFEEMPQGARDGVARRDQT